MKNIQVQTPFSLDHHCNSEVPGKIDRRVYMHLMREGVVHNVWTVKTEMDKLNQFHKWGDSYTQGCLERLRKRGLVVPVCKTKSGKIYLLPALTQWVSEPKGLKE